MSLTAPFRLPRTGRLLRNRTVLAAMTNQQSHEDGQISEAEHRWLVRRAEGGFGIVTTAATHVHPGGQGWAGELGVWGDHQLPGLTRLATALREAGAVSLAQVFHGGQRAPSTLTGCTPVSASDQPAEERAEAARALEASEIIGLVDSFADAAARCEAAGFDGVEVHGAHSYLVSQFLGTKSNRRTDAWGGDLPGRARFLHAIIDAIRARTAPDFLVVVRISPRIDALGITVADSLALARRLAAQHIDLLHISCWDGRIQDDSDPRTLTRRFREALPEGFPLLDTGEIWTEAEAEAVVAEGADLVGVARAAIGHPDWARHLGTGTYNPARPPFSPDQLRAADLSPPFVEYMRRWQGFVTDGR